MNHSEQQVTFAGKFSAKVSDRIFLNRAAYVFVYELFTLAFV